MDPAIVPTRMGHYHTPGGENSNGHSQVALVVGVNEESVNVIAWSKDGTRVEPHQEVPISGLDRPETHNFHLVSACNANCPLWQPGA